MLFDISPLIGPALGVWPGDTPPSREVLLDLRRGDTVTLSTLRATAHLGAHADAPSHYALDAPSIEARALDYYLGACQVVRVAAARGTRVTTAMVPTPISEPRVLLATGTFPDPDRFTTDFAAFDPALIEAWARLGVRLVGIDTPSVDLCDSKDLPAHRQCLRNDMAILEGLDLARVPEGRYELIALPLRLQRFDASPVRAVLRTL